MKTVHTDERIKELERRIKELEQLDTKKDMGIRALHKELNSVKESIFAIQQKIMFM